MQLITVTPPTKEPVSYLEAKNYLKEDLDIEQDEIEAQVRAARELCEDISNKTYFTTVYKYIDDGYNFPIKLPKPPIQSVEKIEFQQKDGTLIEWDASNYVADTTAKFGLIRLAENYSIPDNLTKQNTIQITFTAGHENVSDIPERYKTAVKYLANHWMENRLPVSMNTMTYQVEFTVKSLLGLDRVVPV